MSSSSRDWNGWFTGAVVTGALFVYTGWINEHPGPLRPIGDGRYRADYSCGAIFNPAYPKDGKGPCTDILNDATWVPIMWIAATVVLVIVGFRTRGNRS